MTLTLELSSEMEERLLAAARARGVAPSEYALKVLDESLSEKDRREQAIALLRSWRSEEIGDTEREEFEELQRAIDEDRLSNRKLFPPDLKEVSW